MQPYRQAAPRSADRGSGTSRRSLSRRQAHGQKCLDYFIRHGVAYGLQPLPAASPMEPPFAMHAVHVLAQVTVGHPLALRRILRGTRAVLSAKTKLVHGTLAALRTADKERHQ